MATYILLMTLTLEGQRAALQDPGSILRMHHHIEVPGVQVLGLYAVLGDYDYVGMIEAPDNGAAAQYSLEMGVRAMVHITTLPAVPLSRLEGLGSPAEAMAEAGAPLPPDDRPPDELETIR